MRWRQRYISRSKLIAALRLALGGITAAAPRPSSSALSQSMSNALSPSRAPKTTPSISGCTPTLSWRWPGSRMKRTRVPSASTRATILVVRPPRERPMAWLRVPPLAPLAFWWAVTIVPSIRAYSKSGSPDRHAKTSCCMGRWFGRTDPLSRLGSCDPDVFRTPELEHVVQHVDSDRHFGRLAAISLRAQPVPDDAFPPRDIGL